MDLNIALRVYEPPVPTKFNTQQEKASYDHWKRFNRLSMMLIKARVGKYICGSIPNYGNMKNYFNAIEQRFETSNKH